MQAERTALAWSRTGFSVLVNALLVLRAGLSRDTVPLSWLAIALLAAAAAAILYGGWRRRGRLSDRPSIAPRTESIAIAAVVALGTCIAGLASVFMAH
jgi:uncharacterized membrane protein YidH (DUF202 family)